MRNFFGKSKSVVTEAANGLRSLDQFSEHFVMKLSHQEDRVSSYMGFCLTFLVQVIVALFLYAKAKAWDAKSEVDIMSSLIENAFTYNDTFDSTHGLYVAAGLTEYNSNTTMLEEPRYGELIIEHYGWGYDGELGSQSKSLNYHFCSEEELGLKPGADQIVYPLWESQIEEVTTYKNKFKCLDKEDLIIWGDYNSRKAQQIAVKFKMCEGHDYCEDKATIKQWLAGKFIILLSNQITFNQEEFHAAASQAESRMVYIPVSSQVRSIYPYKLSQTHLELQDHEEIMLDSWTVEEHTDLFKLTRQDLQPYEREDNTWVSVTFEMDLNLLQYEREVYTLFELLSDVGGLTGILMSICALLMTVWNYNSFDNFMVTNLFKIRTDSADKEDRQGETIRLGSFPHCKELLFSLLCHCCSERCCKRSRRAHAMHLARKRLAKETNIIEIVRARRFITRVTQILVPKDKIKEIKAECQYLTVDPDTDSDAMQSEKIDRSSKTMPIAKCSEAPQKQEIKLSRRDSDEREMDTDQIEERNSRSLELAQKLDRSLGTIERDVEVASERNLETLQGAHSLAEFRLPRINDKGSRQVRLYNKSAMGKSEAQDTCRPLSEL